ncbi:MAG: gamma-glutamyl-gamma-aminobutyrate hydrolase family protein [Terriglobia bacterium]
MKIAISVSAEEKAKGAKSPYVRALVAAGAAPEELCLVTTQDTTGLHIGEYDGLLLAGGLDLDPALYGEEKNYENVRADRARDDFELRLLDRALHLRLPVFGICRGAQLINVKFRGTLYQDLKSDWIPRDDRAAPIEHRQPGDRSDLVHNATVTDSSSRLAEVVQGEFRVNSLHHQGIKRLGHGLKVTAHAEDGLVEALEAADEGGYLVAVQWHPEELIDHTEHQRLMAQFVEECRANAKPRAVTQAG